MIAGPLYLLCLMLEQLNVLVRGLAGFGLARVLGASGEIALAVAVTVALFPLALSLATFLVGVPGGWGLFWELGARRPSPREKALVKPVLERLKSRGAITPMAWFVIDDPVPNAQTLGRTVYIHSGVIGHPAMEAILAHECGHIATLTGDVLLALVRLELPGLRALRVYLETESQFIAARVVRIFSGGGSWELPILRSLWAAYLRHGEHSADRYAKRLGYAFELVEYLDAYERPLDGATPFRRGRSHPYAEQRIGKLLG